jgi:predicted Zn-dependent protease with MMP-like domain
MPYRTSKKHFEDIAADAVRDIPDRFRELFKNISVIVEDYPDDNTMEQLGVPRDGLLGLFSGEAYEEKDSFFRVPSPYPDTIHLYQKNIEDICESEEELKEEIRLTILHEVGHYFGLSEEDLSGIENDEYDSDG